MGEHGMPWSAPPAHRQTGLFQVSKGSPRSKSVKMLKEKCKLLGLLERIKKMNLWSGWRWREVARYLVEVK
jgi:hypothetical protein